MPNVREGLVAKYALEKEEQLKVNETKNYIKERETENYSLFRKSDFEDKKSLDMMKGHNTFSNKQKCSPEEQTISLKRSR